MKIITAKIVDATHVELSQPLAVPPGASLQIAIPEAGDEEHLWRAADTSDQKMCLTRMG